METFVDEFSSSDDSSSKSMLSKESCESSLEVMGIVLKELVGEDLSSSTS